MKAVMSDRLRKILDDPENRKRLRKALSEKTDLILKNGERYLIEYLRKS